MNYLIILKTILTLLKRIPNLFKNFWVYIKKYYSIILIILVVSLGFISYGLYNKLGNKNREIDRLSENVLSYEQIASNSKEQNRVLKLTIVELNSSQDSLLQQLNNTRQKLKIKDKQLKSAAIIKTEVKDSISVQIVDSVKNFNVDLILNDLTTIIVTRKDSIITAKLELYNTQTLYVLEKKEYKRKYKNGWSRFWHFDWKKVPRRKYQINNSNSLIKTIDTRIVEIEE